MLNVKFGRANGEDLELPVRSAVARTKQQYIASLPKPLQDFIQRYQKEFPDMEVDDRLMGLAGERAIEAGGHPADLNGRVRKTGYPLPPGVGDLGNQFESLWGANDAQGALDGWRGHPGHMEHVFRQTWPYAGYKHFGVGYDVKGPGAYGQWVIISAP